MKSDFCIAFKQLRVLMITVFKRLTQQNKVQQTGENEAKCKNEIADVVKDYYTGYSGCNSGVARGGLGSSNPQLKNVKKIQKIKM